MFTAILVGGLILLVGSVVLYGLRKIPAEPPTKAAVTRLGERTGKVKNEGWRFFFGYPYIYNYIKVDITKKNFDLTPQDVRTAGDMVEVSVNISVTWQPDADKSYLIEYLNSGGESGIKSILQDVIEEAVREFAADDKREPYTWEDAVKMKKKFLAEIVATIMGKDPQQISSDEISKIVSELRRGNGSLKMETMGIILNRVNVTSIKPKNLQLAEAAEKAAKEQRDKIAETIELRHISERVEELKKIGISNEQALEIIQTERSKVKKDIAEKKLSISQETRDMIKEVGPELISAAAMAFAKKED